MSIFFVNFFLLLLAASMVTNGFFYITRGHKETMPDGTVLKRGALLKGWYFFWFMEKSEPIVWKYSGDELQSLSLLIRNMLPGNVPINVLKLPSDSISDCVVSDGFITSADFATYIPKLRSELSVKFHIEQVVEDVYRVSVFKEEPDYVFPWYLRTVMAGCITCFSSLYGTLIFVLAHILFSADTLYSSFYCFFGTIPVGRCVVFMWAAFCLCLAYLNTYLWNNRQ